MSSSKSGSDSTSAASSGIAISTASIVAVAQLVQQVGVRAEHQLGVEFGLAQLQVAMITRGTVRLVSE